MERYARQGGELFLAGLVLWAGWQHLGWQHVVPPQPNGLWGTWAACVDGPWAARLGITIGHTLEFLLALLGPCRFDGWSVRWPHALAMIAALFVAAFGARRRREPTERWLATLFLVGTPYALYYAYHARPYAWLILFGTTAWVYRDGPRWPRWLTGTLAALSAPFGVPLWAAFLLAEGRRRRCRGWWAEAATLLVVTVWEVWLLTGPAATIVTFYHYRWDLRAGAPFLMGWPKLFGWPFAPWSTAGWLLSLVLGSWGLLGARRLRGVVGTALAFQALGWLVLRPPLYGRYLLATAQVWPLAVARGVARLPARWRRWAAMALGAVWFATGVRFWGVAPAPYWHVEVRVDPEPLLAGLAPGDWIVTDGSLVVEPLLWRLLAERSVTIALLEPRGSLYGEIPAGSNWLLRAQGMPWARGRVRRFATLAAVTAAVPATATLWGAGLYSAPPQRCREICAEALARSAPRFPVWELPREAVRFCRERRPRGYVRVTDPEEGWWATTVLGEGLGRWLRRCRTGTPGRSDPASMAPKPPSRAGSATTAANSRQP